MDLQLPEAIAMILTTIPMGRMGEPDELAKAAVFLGSHDSSFVAGINRPRSSLIRENAATLWRMAMRAMEAKTFSGYGGLRQKIA